jgi:hypothetical protein
VDPAKIAVIDKWPLPKSLKELQSFLGLANYFRKFVDHFSSVVAPLTALTGATGKGRARKPIQAVDWNNLSEEQVKAFQEIKQLLVTAPVLAIPDLNKPFQVHTDATVVGTGGALMQEGRIVSSQVQSSHLPNLTMEHLSRSCLGLCAPCKFGGATWRALQTVSSLRTITHSFTCKRNQTCLEGKQGGWNFCHVSHLS